MTGKPKLLVTGLSGLIGSRLARRLGGRYELAALDLETGVDLTVPGSLETAAAAHPDAVAMVHLAAFTDVNAAHEQDGQLDGTCYAVNVLGARNVVEYCRSQDLPLIHISTDFVFDGRCAEPYREDTPALPIEWYGRTKLFAEQAVRAWDGAVVLRIAFPYTAPPAPKADLVRWILSELEAGRTLKLFSDQIITPTWTGDIVGAIELMARRPAPGELFHVTGSQAVSPHELGLKIAGVFGFDPQLIEAASLREFLKPGTRPRQMTMRISNEKWSAHALAQGLAAPLGVDEGLRRLKAEIRGGK